MCAGRSGRYKASIVPAAAATTRHGAASASSGRTPKDVQVLECHPWSRLVVNDLKCGVGRHRVDVVRVKVTLSVPFCAQPQNQPIDASTGSIEFRVQL